MWFILKVWWAMALWAVVKLFVKFIIAFVAVRRMHKLEEAQWKS